MTHNISIIGTGYVGLVSGACLSDFGHSVICVDTDEKKIERLKSNEIPIFETGLQDVVTRNIVAGRLSFTTDVIQAIRDSEVIFIAVGTPPTANNSADLHFIEAVARTIGQVMNSHKVIVNKSTVPIGTGQKVKAWISEELAARDLNCTFDVVSNPEFLREGSAVFDFMHPDRVVIGVESERPTEIMKAIYRVLCLNNTPFIETNLETAEMIKYASNAFLAVKITYINEIANLCEAVGANIIDVTNAMGRDGRIGPKFLHPGPGYGGSCLPKDTKALAALAHNKGTPLMIVEAAIEANERQKHRMVSKIEAVLGKLEGCLIAVLGLAFKPNTDDMREAPSINIIRDIVARGARIRAHDPAAIVEAQWRLADIGNKITYCTEEYDTVKDADALVVLTEWNQFRNLDLARIKCLLRRPIICDLRNIYDIDAVVEQGFTYIGVGR